MKAAKKLCPNCGTTDPKLFSDKAKKNTRCISCNRGSNENGVYREAKRKADLLTKFLKPAKFLKGNPRR
jgi:uncharacterized protein (DUF983 family)